MDTPEIRQMNDTELVSTLAKIDVWTREDSITLALRILKFAGIDFALPVIDDEPREVIEPDTQAALDVAVGCTCPIGGFRDGCKVHDEKR